MCAAWPDLAGNPLTLHGCFEGSIVRVICRYETPWEGRDDHTKRPTTSGSGNQGRRADLWSPRVVAPHRGGGLTQFVAHVQTLQPGSRTGDRHWHEEEDELLYVLSGEATVVEE